MEIRDSEATFTINLIGERTNQTYMGSFKVKCILSPSEEISADKQYRQLLGDNSHLAQGHVRALAFALAQLEYRIVQEPEFWKGDATMAGAHIPDHNVILEIFDKAVEAQETYLLEKKRELKQRQDKLTEMIRKKDIEPEPDADEAIEAQEKDIEIEEDDIDGATLE